MGTKWKLQEGKMVNSVVSNIRQCGIPFAIWNDNDNDKASYKFSSLVAT